MALRSRHGTARSHGVGRVVEILPPDELPAGVAAPAAPVARDESGRIRTPEAARELGKRGGLAKAARRTKLGAFARAMQNDFPELVEDERLAPFVEEAQAFYLRTCEHFAALVGGGQCSATIAAHVEAASTARMFARFYRAVATRRMFLWQVADGRKPQPRLDYAAASMQQFAAMRTALAAAHEYAAKEALARASRATPADHQADLRARLIGAGELGAEDDDAEEGGP